MKIFNCAISETFWITDWAIPRTTKTWIDLRAKLFVNLRGHNEVNVITLVLKMLKHNICKCKYLLKHRPNKTIYTWNLGRFYCYFEICWSMAILTKACCCQKTYFDTDYSLLGYRARNNTCWAWIEYWYIFNIYLLLLKIMINSNLFIWSCFLEKKTISKRSGLNHPSPSTFFYNSNSNIFTKSLNQFYSSYFLNVKKMFRPIPTIWERHDV